MVYISKTLIPGKTPIGSATGGGYMYDDKDKPASLFSPTQNMSVPGQNMSIPKKVTPIPMPYGVQTGVPGLGSTPITPFAPSVGFSPERAKQINQPVKDTLNFRTKIVEDSPRVQQLRKHFRALEQKGEFQLNEKQTEYIRKFKAKYPDYENVPDVSLYSKIILAEPKAQEQYGNIGEKGFLERLVRLPSDIATTGGEAINESRDVFQERQKTLNQSGNLGLTNLLAGASAARAGANTVLGGVGDILNLASPLINPETGVTSITEGLTRDLGTMVEKVPEEYRQQISDLITRYPKITATLGTAFDLSNLIPFLGALGKAKSAGQVDDILRTVKARPATRFRGEVSPTAFEAGMNRSLISDVAQIPVKTTKATLKGTAKAGEFTGETAIATGVGISKPSQQAIKEAPELYKQARTGALTRETATEEVVSTLKKRLGELSDTGKEYNTIRQSPVTMPKQDFGKILDDFFKENDISKIDMPVKDRKVVQQAIDYIAEYDDVLSAKNGLSLRRKLDDLADWSTDATGEGKRLIRKLRGKVDEYLGEKIPGLKDLDAKYAPEVSFLKKVKSGILNADGSIKDSAISYVANIVGKGKEMKLDRLEELLPGIGQKVRALKAFEEVQAISSMKTGSIMRQLSGVALGNTVVPGFGAIAGFIATNPNIVAFALEKYGMAKKAIQALLKKGAKITPDEAVKVKQAVDAVPSNEVSTFLLGAGEQRKLLMPPKQGDNIIKQLGGGDTPTPSSSLPSRTSEASSIQKLLQEPQKPQKTPGKSSVLSQLSKGKEKSAGKKVNNSIIQKLKENKAKNSIIDRIKEKKTEVKANLPKTPQVEGKTVQPKITDMYEKSGMTPEMAKIARNLDESFGLDVSKSDYIDEYVSQKLGKKFRYSPDLAGRYSPEIETAIKEAKDIYSKFRAKPSPPLSQKSEGKTVPKEILDEMNNYDNAHDFAMNAMIGPGGKVYKIGDNVKVETMAGTVDGKITKNIGKTNIVDEGKPKSSGYIQDSPNGHPVQVTLKDGTKIDTNLGLIDQDSTGDYIFGKKQSDKLRELFESKAKPKPSLTLSQKSEGKTLKDNLEWTPSSKLDQDIFYVDRNGIRQTEFESAGKNIKGQRAGYTMEEYLNKNGLSKDDFTLSKGTDGADGLYVLNEKGLSKLEKLKEKKNNIVEGLKKAKVDTELESLQKIQESMPGVPSIEVPKDYTPTGGLPTGTEFEAPIISSISKTKGKLPSPEIKRPQIRGFDLSTRSSMLESLKEQGMFTDSFFVVKDKNVSNKLFEYAEKKAIKKGNPTSGTKVDMKALVERAENGADTLLTPKEYMKLGKENGVYLRMDIGNGNQVAVNASYADIFFKNFDDVTFKGNNELSPVVVLSKGEPVGVIMPIKDVYNLKDKIGDFSMQSKTPQVEGKTVEIVQKNTVETLPSDVNIADEAKKTGAKRIAPDRIAHQQLTPEEGINKMREDVNKAIELGREVQASRGNGVRASEKTYQEYLGMKKKLDEGTLPEYHQKYLERNKEFFKDLEKVRPMNALLGKDKTGSLRRDLENLGEKVSTPGFIEDAYKEAIKKDISRGYKYPDAVIKSNPEFEKALTARERYEKGLDTSFGADDSRIVFDDVETIGAGMKRQDGKALTPEMKKHIVDGVTDFADTLGLDMKKLAENDRWVYVHLNDKNPFLMKDVAGLYRKDPGKNSISISVGGKESFEKVDEFGRPMKDAEGKVIKEEVHTTMAHELGHALDFKVDNKLIDSKIINELSDLMNKDATFKAKRKYYSKPKEIVARMIEQYVAEAKGHTGIRTQTAQWSKEIFESKVKPAVEQAIKEQFPEFVKIKEKT